jgi:hypothetical protein
MRSFFVWQATPQLSYANHTVTTPPTTTSRPPAIAVAQPSGLDVKPPAVHRPIDARSRPQGIHLDLPILSPSLRSEPLILSSLPTSHLPFLEHLVDAASGLRLIEQDKGEAPPPDRRGFLWTLTRWQRPFRDRAAEGAGLGCSRDHCPLADGCYVRGAHAAIR